MPGQKIRGGKEILDRLLDDLDAISETANIPRKDVILDPRGAHMALESIQDQVDALRHTIREVLAPMLERAATNREAASIPDRVARLEAALAELRAVVAHPPNNVVPLREPRERQG